MVLSSSGDLREQRHVLWTGVDHGVFLLVSGFVPGVFYAAIKAAASSPRKKEQLWLLTELAKPFLYQLQVWG